MQYFIYRTQEYFDWFVKETPKSQTQIKDRLLRIELYGHFGTIKDLDNGLWEIKFNDGRRIYYVSMNHKNILLLIGGNKNGQEKDIKKARSIVRKIISDQP